MYMNFVLFAFYRKVCVSFRGVDGDGRIENSILPTDTDPHDIDSDVRIIERIWNDCHSRLMIKLVLSLLYSMNILILQIALICVTSSQIKDKTVFSLNKNIRALPKTSMCCRSDVKKKTNYKSYLKNMLIFFKMMT